MNKIWLQIVGFGTAIVTGVLVLVYLFSRQKGIGKVAADIIEAQTAPKIKKLEQDLAEMEASSKASITDVRRLKAELAQKKANYKSSLSISGLSADEIAERFRRL